MSEKLSDTFDDIIKFSFSEAELGRTLPVTEREEPVIDPALKYLLAQDHVFQRSLWYLKIALEGFNFELQESRRAALVGQLIDPNGYGLDSDIGAKVVDYLERRQDGEA